MPSFHRQRRAVHLVLFSCLAAPTAALAAPVAASAQQEPQPTASTSTSTSTSTNESASDGDSGGFEILPVEPPPATPPASSPSAPAAVALPPADERPLAPPLREPEREWYGWQTLSADASSFGMMFLGGETDSPGLVLVGLGSYALTPAIIHAVHHNDWAVRSLLLRVGGLGLMFGGAVVALSGGCFSLGDDVTPASCGTRAVIGTGLALSGLGMALSAIVLDAVKAHSEPHPAGTPTLALWTNPQSRAAGLSLTLVQ